MNKLIKAIIAFIISIIYYGSLFAAPAWFPTLGDILLESNIIIGVFIMIVPPIIVIFLIASILADSMSTKAKKNTNSCVKLARALFRVFK